MDEKTRTHESFGLLSFHRQQSNRSISLFGSSIRHQNTICLEIHEAEENRSLHRHWYYPRKPIIKVEMSANQFSEAITNISNGCGVPVTIRFVQGKGTMEEVEHASQRLMFEDEFEEDISEISENLVRLKREAENILDKKGNIIKSERDLLKNLIYHLVQDVKDNIPFINRQFNEALDKSTMEAKCEIEAFIQNEITQLGIEAFHEKFKLDLIEFEKRDNPEINQTEGEE